MNLKPVFVTAALFFTFIYAQGKTDSTHSLKAGSWALQFGISNNFTLSNFNGSTFSGKYHLTDNSAIRVGLTLSGQTGDRDQSSSTKYNPSASNEQSKPFEDYNLTLKTAYLFYPNNDKQIKLYFGAGPILGWSKYEVSGTDNNYQNDTLNNSLTEKITRNNLQVGLNGILGAEYFLTSYLSVHAEYSATFAYQIQKQKNSGERIYIYDKNNPQITESDIKQTSWGFYSGSVLFGLSVYL
ncbi:MAG: outer membrane beta-barrel protein [Ignavibacteria bacterium]|nr:outer membrane beta-barrel protein [Ignavibacteria bacterium]